MTKRTAEPQAPEPADWPAPGAPPRPLFPVVALGASAGGLDPIVAFLSHVPPDSGIAFVVIQHLDPDRKPMLPELLARATGMPVHEIAEGMELRPGNVYVIPPNADPRVVDGRFLLAEPAQLRGHRLPINVFFSALAAERGELAVGVVLSGMGTDGTRGLQAIKQHNGLTLAQSPESARFDHMPLSAIGAEVVDLIEAPENMPEKIAAYLRNAALGRAGNAPSDKNWLQEIVRLLGERTGNSFTDYKVNTVLRRIERRMGLHQLASMEQYAAHLRANPVEIDLLFKELLIGVTSFFRDQKVWEYLTVVVLPQMLAAHPEGRAFKAWVPACSTGEEAYSLAMAFADVVALAPAAKYTLQIFATDLSDDAIDRARLGHFPGAIAADVGAERLARFFVAGKSGYHVRKEIRNMIIFARQNIISDPPFTKLDILCCRNLLIYLSARLQQRLIALFHYALNPNGVLLLGSADTPGHASHLFAPLSTSTRLFRRLDNRARPHLPACFPTRVSAASHPTPSEAREAAMPGKMQSHVEQLLLQKYSPAAALLNQDGDILYINGRTGAFLEPAAGKANWNIHAMARDGLRFELAGLIKQALRGDAGVVRMKGLVVRDALGQTQGVDLSAEALTQPEALRGMVFVTFASAPEPAPERAGRSPDPRARALELQLAQARAEIQAVREEMQTSREELKSANEELQSTNEELQSANEELTTSKEEMQSLNEELYTVNAELQSKVDDLSLVNSDMKNLLNSTDIATIFLDSALRIRRFTTPATQIYKLIQSDLRRPLGDIVNDLDYPGLEADALEVIRTLVFSERQVPTRDGRWYNVRIMPYRTIDNVIDGVVVTFINITESKQLEARLRQMQVDDGALAAGA